MEGGVRWGGAGGGEERRCGGGVVERWGVAVVAGRGLLVSSAGDEEYDLG